MKPCILIPGRVTLVPESGNAFYLGIELMDSWPDKNGKCGMCFIIHLGFFRILIIYGHFKKHEAA